MEELLGHHQDGEKGEGPDRKRELGKRGVVHTCVVSFCKAGGQLGSGAGQSVMESKCVWDGLGMRTQGSLFITAVHLQPQQLGGRN